MKEKEQAPHKRTGKINGHTTHRARNKAKCLSYLTRSTCTTCRMVFRSPKKRFLRVESGHKSTIGHNPNRTPKTSAL